MKVELRLPAEASAGEPARPVVVDTNVALDLLIFSDPRTAPLRTLLAQGRLAWIATQVMRDELERVLAYPHIVERMDYYRVDASQVLAAFDARRVVLLRADWTRRDPAITAELTRLGRNGVPVYAFYTPGAGRPRLMSELPTAADLREALAALP